MFIIVCIVALSLSGCSSLVKELRQDPAIVGGTFTGMRVSLTAVPGIPIPLPEILIGRGTFYRIGGDRTVEVMAGDAVSGPLPVTPSEDGARASNSEASMTIKAGTLTAEPPARATIP